MQEGSDDAPPRVQGEAEALAHDARVASAELGWSLEQVQRNVEARDPVGKIGAWMAESYPERFVATVLPSPEHPRSRLLIVGQSFPELEAKLAATDVAIELVDNQPYSFTSLTEAVSSITDTLEALKVSGFSVTADVLQDGLVTIAVPSTQDLAVLSSADDLLRKPSMPPVQFILAADAPSPDWAGGGMRTAGTGGLCTSGFTVEAGAGGARSVVSAAHCSGINRMAHFSHTHDLYYLREHFGAYGDVEIYSTNTTMTDDFYADYDVVRDVSSVEFVNHESIDELVCVMGRTTNTTRCARIASGPIGSCNYEEGTLRSMVYLDRVVTQDGDSGAPWFYGGRAYGVHSGRCSAAQTVSIFTAAQNLSYALGVRILR